MGVDPFELNPKPGAGLPPWGAVPSIMLRPAIRDCLAGTVPTIPSNPNSGAGYLYRVGELEWQAPDVEDGAVVFLGDSVTAYGDWSMVTPFAWNAGISGEKIEGILARMATISEPLRRAAGVHLHIGVNNLNNNETQSTLKTRMSALMNWLSGPLVVTKVIYQSTTTQKDDTDDFNANIVTTAASRGNCAVVDLNTIVAPGGTLLSQYSRDGLHLSRAGYQAWYPLIRAGFNSLGA